MADTKISALPSASTPLTGAEVLPIVQGGVTEQVSVANLTAGRSVAASALAVDANSASDAVRITQTGAGNALLVEDSANPDSSPFLIDASGIAVSGHTAAVSGAIWNTSTNYTLNYEAVGAGFNTGFGTFAYSSSATAGNLGSNISFNASRNATLGSHTIVNNGDNVGSIMWGGSDGTKFVRLASINAWVDGAPGTDDMPGRLVFSTTLDGASAPSERMRIDNAGRFGFGITTAAGTTMRIGRASDAASYTDVNAGGAVNATVATVKYQYLSTASSTANGGVGYTVPRIDHFTAQQAAFNADTTVTAQHGFRAESSLTGAANNYGFYSNLASAANRWNFFANGTANNAFNGNSRFGGITAPVATVDVTGSVAATTTILSSGATSGVGYATGAGGAVTQATSRTTGVTLNKVCGAITLFSAAGSTTYQTFTVTNSAVAATDTIIVNQKSGTDLYEILVTAVAAGSFNISFRTTGGTTTEQPVFNFAVIKAVAA